MSDTSSTAPFDTTPLTKSYSDITVGNVTKQMAYFDSGPAADTDRSIVFLHGNPTSSYLWRNIIPHVESLGRCVAPDLIGQGDSDKLDDVGPGSYRFVEHREWLDGLLDSLDLGDNIVFVIHDWGSALGFDWAHRQPDRVSGIVYMEAIVMPVPTWDSWPPNARGIFQGMRSEAGEEMVLDKNLFVDAILPNAIIRGLTAQEHEEYRRPFLQAGEDRRPTLTWPREIPIEGEPADVAEIVQAYADWLSASDMPKLFVDADPGAILIGDQREFCRNWPNQREVRVAGNHFIQEDSPHEIGEAIADWIVTDVDSGSTA
ncbi:MAG: haloalkane dehalogenase [Actinobacteria bacterium]|nr:MAG: haloalkane dehalogenase [Actinomycetota bacterium]